MADNVSSLIVPETFVAKANCFVVVCLFVCLFSIHDPFLPRNKINLLWKKMQTTTQMQIQKKKRESFFLQHYPLVCQGFKLSRRSVYFH